LEGVYQRGYRLLVDKDGLAARLPPCPYTPRPAPRPTPAEFQQSVELFWYGALQAAKTLRRGDLWSVKVGDANLKRSLLELLEWHARATRGWDTDTWHGGRFLLEWTDPETRAALDGLFAHFDAADSWWALRNTLALYRRLAPATAAALGCPYPHALEQNIMGVIDRLAGEG
jgi:aminoglycoside 6-adenylyltransferase